MEKLEYDREKYLYEHDPHLLEEQRYYNRLKKFELRKQQNFNKQYEGVLIPELERKQREEELENRRNAKRKMTYDEMLDKKKKMQKDLTMAHAEHIKRQITSKHNKLREDIEHKKAAEKNIRV